MNKENNSVLMNGKPVYTVPAKTVLNMKSDFAHKLLCDGITINPGSACVYRCSYCYVESMMNKNALVQQVKEQSGLPFKDVAVRRENAVGILKKQLTDRYGQSKFFEPTDRRTVFISTTVDPAGNMELARETAEICNVVLDLTNWQIRLLSKSPLLIKIADAIPEKWRHRIIYGFSTGTLNDGIARSIEVGTPLVSKRIAALHELQNRGLRTFCMMCPILPQENAAVYAQQVAQRLHLKHCEHVWAEVLNVRGASMKKTCDALRAAGQERPAKLLEAVSNDRELHEQYSRETFLALSEVIPAGKLRFLQYVRKDTRNWWVTHEHRGAVLLGKSAKGEIKI